MLWECHALAKVEFVASLITDMLWTVTDNSISCGAFSSLSSRIFCCKFVRTRLSITYLAFFKSLNFDLKFLTEFLVDPSHLIWKLQPRKCRHYHRIIIYQSWSPRGHGLGLEAPWGQPIVSLASRVKSLTLASDAKSSASGKMFPVLVLAFEPKSINSLAILSSRWVAVYRPA